MVLLVALGLNLKATHIVGGELYYEYLGNNNYSVTLDYFIDCVNGNPGAIKPDLDGSNFAVFNGSTNQRISSFDRTIAAGLPKRVSETNYKCIITKPNACVDRYQFSFVLNMPPIKGGYIIAFQRCCRNNSITNLLNPDLTGSTFWTKIEDLRTQNWKNSSAHFKELPPNFLCTNAPLVFDHSAVDPDGDSLVYELFHPFNSYQGNSGARPGSPKPTGAGFLPPPFPQVNWANGYSASKQIDATNNFILNPTTGLLNFTPTQTGQFVVGILVKEYRNGVLVGTTRRDFQFNVSDCTFEVVSSFLAPVKSCAFTVSFNNNSSGTSGLSYAWDFGEKDDISDQSNQTFPTYTYSKSGTYEIQLIAKTSQCADTYTRIVRIVDPVYPQLGPDDTLCSPFTHVLDANINTEAISWNTGEIGSRITVNKEGLYIATYQKEGCAYKDSVYLTEDLDFPELPLDTIFCNNDPFIYTIDAGARFKKFKWNTNEVTQTIATSTPGLHYVDVTTSNGCVYRDSMYINQQLPPALNLRDTLVCPGFPGRFDAGSDEVIYTWSTGETNATISPMAAGSYWVTIFDGRCYNYDTATLENVDVGPYGLPNDTAFCNKVFMVLNPGSQFARYQWNTGESTPTITVQDRGSYSVILTSKEGCIVSDSMRIGLNPLPTINLGPDTTVCQAINPVLDPGPGIAYLWQDESSERTLTAYESGIYHVMLTDHNGCINGDTIEIFKDPNALPSDLFMPNAFSPNGDGLNDVYPNNQYQDIGVEYNLKIFTRWGEKLEDFNSPNYSWDGIYKGEPMAEGVYIYLVNWIGCDNKRRQKTGNVTLLK